jgi:hypothetical protein
MKPMYLYRIYTEDKDEQAVRKTLAAYQIEAYTVIHGQGVREGRSEASIIIEVLSDWSIINKIQFVCQQLKCALAPQAVLFTVGRVEGRLI